MFLRHSESSPSTTNRKISVSFVDVSAGIDSAETELIGSMLITFPRRLPQLLLQPDVQDHPQLLVVPQPVVGVRREVILGLDFGEYRAELDYPQFAFIES